MPRPPEAGDYLVLMGWSVEGIHQQPGKAQKQASALKRSVPNARVIVAYVTEVAALPPKSPLRKEDI